LVGSRLGGIFAPSIFTDKHSQDNTHYMVPFQA